MDDKNDSSLPPTENGNFIEPAPMRWTLRLIFIVVFLVGVIGNSVVCMAVIRRKRMRTSNNIFTFNLAFSDLLNVVIYLPSQMAAFENGQNWALGNFMCHFTYILVPLCLSASIATLLAITSDRYRAIAYPMKPRLSGKKVKIILVIIWTGSFLICSPLAFVAGEIYPEPGKVYCDENWPKAIYGIIYWNFIFVIQYFLPLAMIAVLAVLIAMKIRQNSAVQLLPKSSQVVAAAVRQRMKQTAKITNMLIALVILYAICMLPQHIVFLWWTYGDLGTSKYRVYVLRFSNVFPMANSALNPIAYGTLNKEFKTVFKNFFKCKCSKADLDDRFRSSVMGRNGMFRLTMHKHKDDESSTENSSEHGRWRRKSSVAFLFRQISTGRNRAAQRERNSLNKAGHHQDRSIQNGNVMSCAYSSSLHSNSGQRNSCRVINEELSIQQGSTNKNLERQPSSKNHASHSDGQKSINTVSPKKPLVESTDGGEMSTNGILTKQNLETGKERDVYRSVCECTKNKDSGKDCDNNELHPAGDLQPKLRAFEDSKCSLADCWLDSDQIMNREDESLLQYIRALKETDL